jgi:hypothetical protein
MREELHERIGRTNELAKPAPAAEIRERGINLLSVIH